MPSLAEILAAAKAKAATEPAKPQENPLAAALAATKKTPVAPERKLDKLSGPSWTTTTTSNGAAETPNDTPDAISAEEMAIVADVVDAELEADGEADDETDVGAAEFTHTSQPDKFDTAEYRQYREYFAIVKDSFGYPEQLADAMQLVMEHVRAHPFLADILHAEDIGTMVSALRESYGVAITRKSSRREKKAVVKADVAEAMDFLNGVEIKI